MQQMRAQISGALIKDGQKYEGQKKSQCAGQTDQAVDVFLFACGIKAGSQIGDPCLKSMADQCKAEHVYRKNQLINTQFFCTNQVGRKYSVIETQNSGKKSG